MSLYVKNNVKKALGQMRASEDFWTALEKFLNEAIKKAIERAKANGRKTVRASDL